MNFVEFYKIFSSQYKKLQINFYLTFSFFIYVVIFDYNYFSYNNINFLEVYTFLQSI